MANLPQRFLEIAKKFEFEHKVFRDFNTSLILKLIAEIHEDEKLFASANLYGIFETFVRKKVRIWIEIIEIFQKLHFLRNLKFCLVGLKI